MKKTYIAPILMVDEAEMIDGLLTVTSIEVSDDSGNEQYVREQTAGDGNWTIDW
ncbi:MAG: hypothetical protein IKW91_01780 [Bacteroidaceae bacterium]|nr:hypothetical protein [Bacteroidaceae bacterium]